VRINPRRKIRTNYQDPKRIWQERRYKEKLRLTWIQKLCVWFLICFYVTLFNSNLHCVWI
jgi:uncharacterized membrane protein